MLSFVGTVDLGVHSDYLTIFGKVDGANLGSLIHCDWLCVLRDGRLIHVDDLSC